MSLNPLYSQIPENPNLVAMAEKILDRIHSNAVPVLKREIEKRGIVLNGKLLNSLSRHVNVKYQEAIVEMVLNMEATGKFAESKKLKFIGRPNIDSFMEAAMKSVETGSIKKVEKNFWPPKSIPGYKGDANEVIARIGEAKAVQRIVSATVIKMGQQATVTRPVSHVGWFKTYFEEIVYKMNDQLALLGEAVAMKESEAIIKKSIEQRK
jgi:hypothetical protein